MAGFVDATMGIECVLSRRKDRVKLRLLHVGFMAVDGFQSRIGIYGKTVRPEAKNRAVKLMTTIELKMTVSFPSMVYGIPVRDFGEKGSGVFSEGMESQPVYCQECKLEAIS